LNAEAFREYGEAATLDLIAAILPELVSAASEPLSAIDQMTVISTEGASQVTRSVASNVEQGIQIGSDLTGVDLRSLLGRLGGPSSMLDDDRTGDGTA
jgi:flotillin